MRFYLQLWRNLARQTQILRTITTALREVSRFSDTFINLDKIGTSHYQADQRHLRSRH
jgi:hypothetical protein